MVTVRVTVSGASPLADAVTSIRQRPGSRASVSEKLPPGATVRSRAGAVGAGEPDGPLEGVARGVARGRLGVAGGWLGPGDASAASSNSVVMTRRVPVVVPLTVTWPSWLVKPSVGPRSVSRMSTGALGEGAPLAGPMGSGTVIWRGSGAESRSVTGSRAIT